MSMIGLSFYFSFGANVLIVWGLIPKGKEKVQPDAWTILGFIVAASLATLLDGLVYRHILGPSGLESLAPVLFALFLSSGFVLLHLLKGILGKSKRSLLEDTAFQATLVLYATAMMISDKFSSPWHLLGGGAAAIFGYIAASGFLTAIMDRLELEPVPAPFKGEPIRFLSASLMALAFSGVDSNFFFRYFG
jgi:electron transport complex protein RnfA